MWNDDTPGADTWDDDPFWILRYGAWNDGGTWADERPWRDAEIWSDD